MNNIYNTHLKRSRLNLEGWHLREKGDSELLLKEIDDFEIELCVNKETLKTSLHFMLESVTIWKGELPEVIDFDFLKKLHHKLHFNEQILSNDFVMEVIGDICKLQPLATQLYAKSRLAVS